MNDEAGKEEGDSGTYDHARAAFSLEKFSAEKHKNAHMLTRSWLRNKITRDLLAIGWGDPGGTLQYAAMLLRANPHLPPGLACEAMANVLAEALQAVREAGKEKEVKEALNAAFAAESGSRRKTPRT